MLLLFTELPFTLYILLLFIMLNNEEINYYTADEDVAENNIFLCATFIHYDYFTIQSKWFRFIAVVTDHRTNADAHNKIHTYIFLTTEQYFQK